MLYIIYALAGLLFIVALFTYIFQRKKSDTTQDDEINFPDQTCCGAHEVCEKGLKKINLDIVYFEDEELDILKEVAGDAYTVEQIDMFRDVLYTLKKNEIEDWLLSLEKRKINFPECLKQEAISLLDDTL